MFLTIEQGRWVACQEGATSSNQPLAGYITKDECQSVGRSLGFTSLEIDSCTRDQANLRNSVEAYQDHSFGIFNIMEVTNPEAARDRMAFYLNASKIIFVVIRDDDDSDRQLFQYAVDRYGENPTPGKVLFGVLDKLLEGGYPKMDECNTQITSMEAIIMEDQPSANLNKRIFRLKIEVSDIRQYYEQLQLIGTTLEENENNLLGPEDLRYLSIFVSRANRLVASYRGLESDLSHLADTYNATIDINLNNIMKVLTIITVIFMPLTLIVGWYGMNFTNMPELDWKYGYLFCIVLSILVVLGTILYFKKKKLL